MTLQELEREQRLLEGQVFPETSSRRLDCIDFVRGAVMIIMALDHIRGPMGPRIDPTNLSQTTPWIFFTRWITHYCAPTFVFLSGTGAYLSGVRGKSKGAISRDFLLRGLWLILLEFTLVKWGWGLSMENPLHLGGGVIWAIGASMVLMSVVVWLPIWLIGAFGLGLICFHNFADPVPSSAYGSFAWVWNMLHNGGDFLHIKDIYKVHTINEKGMEVVKSMDLRFGAGYPLVPWVGVMAAGYVFGAVLQSMPVSQRRKFFVDLGIVMITGFLILRLTNIYGDRQPWVEQPTLQMTVAAVLNCHKYPPSLSYLLMTLGPVMIVLALFDRPLGWFGRFVVVFGRVPLFYYLLHLPLINAFTRLTRTYEDPVTGKTVVGLRDKFAEWVLSVAPRATEVSAKAGEVSQPHLEGWGWTRHSADLLFAYCVWICVILILFPLCYWWANVKKRYRSSWWVSYV